MEIQQENSIAFEEYTIELPRVKSTLERYLNNKGRKIGTPEIYGSDNELLVTTNYFLDGTVISLTSVEELDPYSITNLEVEVLSDNEDKIKGLLRLFRSVA